MRLLLVGLLLAGGCLASPPASVERGPDAAGPPPDAAASPCAGLDRFIESFEEENPLAFFTSLWDPGTALFQVTGGSLLLTADNGESLINSIAALGPTGALRVGPIALDVGGVASISLYNDQGTARITIDQARLELYQVDSYIAVDRQPEDQLYAIEFADGDLLFSASTDGGEWRTLHRWAREISDLVRLSLSVRDPDGLTTFQVAGINTPESGAPCLPE